MPAPHGKLEGRVALVTGAAAGIGRASAIAIGLAGAKLAIADVDEHGLNETAAQVRESSGVDVLPVPCDVSVDRDVAHLVARTVQEFGRLDCCHNNAGVEGMSGVIGDYPNEEFERVLRTNLFGVWYCMQHEIRQMVAQGTGGSIVNTSSISGVIATRRMPAYCTSKAGVLQLTRVAAVDLADQGIRVNAVCPGPIDTAMSERFCTEAGITNEVFYGGTALHRMAQPAEVAAPVVFLLSDDASFITGHGLATDGGYLAL